MSEAKPLAARMRPQELYEFVGQEHLGGDGRVLRKAIDAGQLPSMILWGPPGTGKTTLAAIASRRAHALFVPISAGSPRPFFVSFRLCPETTKLAASDTLRHPYPFRGTTFRRVL